MFVSGHSSRLRQAKRAFSTRRVSPSDMCILLNGSIKPSAGDLVLAQVRELGFHKRLELVSGRKSLLFPGDEIIVCYGNRYAPDQFEAFVGENLDPCHLVASGGLAATAVRWHDRIIRPTAIQPLGLLGNRSCVPVNLKSYALDEPSPPRQLPAIAILGTSMNAGKTTTAAALINGLAAGGHKVGSIKLTGTGSGADTWIMKDAGAHLVLDFTDAGFASTYPLSTSELEQIIRVLVGTLAAERCTLIVAEVADGLGQPQTRALLRSGTFKHYFPRVIFAAREGLGALAGLQLLHEHGFRVPAVSGSLSRSPLMVEETLADVNVEVLTPKDLCQPDVARWLLGNSTLERAAT